MTKQLLLWAVAAASLTVQAESVATAIRARGANPAPARTEAAILETPAGELRSDLTLSEFALFPAGIGIFQRQVDGAATAIVEGEDGCLYVKNPIAVYKTNSWLKLDHVEGTTYVANLPQPASAPWDYEGEEMRFNYDRLAYDEDEEYYYPSFSTSQISFNYENGVLTSTGDMAEDEEMPVMLGLTYDGVTEDEKDEAWAWYGVNNIVVKACEATALTELPGSLEAKTCVLSTADDAVPAWVAVDGENIYLRVGEVPGYIAGTIAEGKAVFASRQYVGIADDSHCYFYGATSEFVEDEDYADGGYYHYVAAGSLSFDYLPEGALLKSADAILFNEGNVSLHAVEIYNEPVVKEYTPVAAAPADPVITSFMAYDDFDEYGAIKFELPAISVDGDEISTINMYYNLYLKGSTEPYEFTSANYIDLPASMVNVPYNFSDGGYDFTVRGALHTVVFYVDTPAIGVQSINVCDGTEYRSAIVWSDGESGVGNVALDSNAPAEYYDLTGRRVESPAGGIFIRRQGAHTTKVILK